MKPRNIILARKMSTSHQRGKKLWAGLVIAAHLPLAFKDTVQALIQRISERSQDEN